MESWQESLLDKLRSYFEADEDVLGLLLFGSTSRHESHPDPWSDLDLLVVVQDDQLGRFFPTTDWLGHFGKLYAYSQSSDDFKYTTRACFENFNRVDFVFTAEGKFAEINKSAVIPFHDGLKVIFSRSKIVDEVAAQHYSQAELHTITQEQFLELVRDFRFKSMLAVYKVVRNDLLIALHLAEDLVRDCCVLGMLLRDRTTGTNFHKDGGVGNELVKHLEATQKPFTSCGILDSIEKSNEVFEKLACEWSGQYQEARQPLLDWIEQAKAELRA